MTGDLDEMARGLAWLWNPVPIGIVATWAVIGVVGMVLVVRLGRDNFGVKLGASLVAIGGAGLVLLCAAQRAQAPTYYKYVDEVVAERDALRSRRDNLEVHGLVVPESLEQRCETDKWRFRLESRSDRPPALIEVRYTGDLPDAIQSATRLDRLLSRRVEVLARGTLAADGTLDVIPDGFIVKKPVD